MEKLTLNNLTIILATSTMALAVAVWHCYRTSKPLKKAAREKAEADAHEKAAQEEQGRERNRRDVFRKETLQVLSSALSDPHRLMGQGHSLEHLRRFIEKVNHHQSYEEDLKLWKDRVSKQSELIREIQMNQKDIQKALQMGRPVEL